MQQTKTNTKHVQHVNLWRRWWPNNNIRTDKMNESDPTWKRHQRILVESASETIMTNNNTTNTAVDVRPCQNNAAVGQPPTHLKTAHTHLTTYWLESATAANVAPRRPTARRARPIFPHVGGVLGQMQVYLRVSGRNWRTCHITRSHASINASLSHTRRT